MKTEAEFKFAPFWIIILTLLTFYFIYSGFNTIYISIPELVGRILFRGAYYQFCYLFFSFQ